MFVKRNVRRFRFVLLCIETFDNLFSWIMQLERIVLIVWKLIIKILDQRRGFTFNQVFTQPNHAPVKLILSFLVNSLKPVVIVTPLYLFEWFYELCRLCFSGYAIFNNCWSFFKSMIYFSCFLLMMLRITSTTLLFCISHLPQLFLFLLFLLLFFSFPLPLFFSSKLILFANVRSVFIKYRERLWL